MMRSVMAAIKKLEIGVVAFNLIMPHDGGTGGPKFETRKYNPREATKRTMKELWEDFQKTSGGLIKDRAEFAIFMAVRLNWIENLDEIMNYRPDSGDPLPRVKWSSKAKDEIAQLLNGNHRFKLLEQILEAHIEQLREVRRRIKACEELAKPNKKRREQLETDKQLEANLKKLLKDEGLFAVKLFDMGE
jgi:hypothetical protein